MLKRTAIYCFFSKSGKVYGETYKQIYDLRKCVDYLIIVINGKAEAAECFTVADRVIVRPNMGLDAGAYKYIICSTDYKETIKASDELVLCNSTFFGPFCGFKKIFDEMEKRNADFWGISFSDQGILRHIHSFFFVFNKKVLNDEEFYRYFRKNIDESTTNYFEVCYFFEFGFFDFLVSRGYIYDSFIPKLEYSMYQYPIKVMEMGLPILKKKIFSGKCKKSHMVHALQYVNEKYNYDLKDIFEEIENEYDTGINIEYLEECEFEEEATKIFVSTKTWEEIKEFVNNSSNLYLYGTGFYAYVIYQRINSEKVQGFIVSEDVNYERTFFGKKVFICSEMAGTDKEQIDLLLALSCQNTNEVKDNLVDFRNVFDLWT